MDIPILSLAVAWSLLTVLSAEVVACSPAIDTAAPRIEATSSSPRDRPAAAFEPDFLFATDQDWQAYARGLKESVP